MDGSDGLASGWAVISAASLAYAALLFGEFGIAAGAAAAAAAGLGFLPWNLRRRVFQGDVGAFFSAAFLGGLGLLLTERGGATPYLVVFTALPLIVDVLLTLIVRARRGGRLFEAHKEHLYQLWLQATGRPHLALALRIWILTAITAATGLVLEFQAPNGPSPDSWRPQPASVRDGFCCGLGSAPGSPEQLQAPRPGAVVQPVQQI
jgi:UDP-N-acetylmuramyl pentapeptide phosphotransferase/UDP-N-acetylglucosamine-1-phosphate transferase